MRESFSSETCHDDTLERHVIEQQHKGYGVSMRFGFFLPRRGLRKPVNLNCSFSHVPPFRANPSSSQNPIVCDGDYLESVDRLFFRVVE